jgi:hypothetical protein
VISDELQRIYASAPANLVFYEGLVLEHPAWPESVRFATNTVDPITKNFNATPVLFNPASFELTMPRRDDSGLVELAVTFPLVSRTMVEMIDAAEQSRQPIVASLTVYIDASDDPQMTPIQLYLSDIAMTDDSVTGIASRVDLINKGFPRVVVKPENYPGLYR